MHELHIFSAYSELKGELGLRERAEQCNSTNIINNGFLCMNARVVQKVLTHPEVDFRDFHINSQMATKKANERPPNSTTNTPPTLSILRAVTDEDFLPSSTQAPPPFFCFHHFSFNMNSLPVSCSLSIA